jgi:hypothetical protein
MSVPNQPLVCIQRQQPVPTNGRGSTPRSDHLFHSTGWRSFRLARGLVRTCQGKRVTDSGCFEKGLSAFLLAVVLIAGEVREVTRDRD